MFGIDDLIMGGLTLAGGFMKNKSDDDRQASTNAFNAAEGAKTREFNAAEAQKNRDFQNVMSSTAYQRGMADMKTAGLNPILAYQKGGASSPTGASASTGIVSGVSPKDTADVIGPAVSSAQHSRRLNQELENMASQNENLKRQNDLIHAQTAQSLSQTTANEAQAKNTTARTAIEVENLHGAKKNAVEADLAKENLDTFAGRWASRIGHGAQMVKPAIDLINSAKRIPKPY